MTTTTHAPVPAKSSLRFCTCGEGFSGANAEERLQAHIESPDPNSLGALLIAYVTTATA
jgi:hypothetical protein